MSKVRKIQVSIPEEHYEEIEKRWKAYGYPSLATAAKVVLMGNTAEHVRELRRIESNTDKAKELYAKNERAKNKLQENNDERTKTSNPVEKKLKKRNGKTVVDTKELSRNEPKVENILVQWLEKKYIDQEKYNKAKGLKELTYDDGTYGYVVWV